MEVKKQAVISARTHTLYLLGWTLGRSIEVLRFLVLRFARWIIQFCVGTVRLISGWFDLFIRRPVIASVMAGVSVVGILEILLRLGVRF